MAERSPEIENEIIARISEGEPLAAICRDEHMPSDRAVRYWQDEDEQFASAIARARLDGFDAIAARVRMTARGKTEADGGDSSGDVQRDKLIVDTDLKLLAKWDPKRYGDRQLLGSDPDNPLPTGFQVNLVKAAASGSAEAD
jgi:hypothetical protein